MKKYIPFLIILLSGAAVAQVPLAYKGDTTEILKAEDSRRYESVIERFLVGTYDEKYVIRALLAAGRIGDERAIPRVERLLKEGSPKVREMAAFALGEIESLKAADAILAALKAPDTPDIVRARAVEAAGKIAAANAGPANAPAASKDPKVTDLGNAILDTLEAEDAKREKQYLDTVLLGLTAALRARPEGSENVVAAFLTNLNSRVRADAANTLARLRAKNANMALHAMLMSDEDPVARANAARALGAAEDKEAVNMLIDAATEDDDSRVRVSAIRALAALRDPYAVERLLNHGEKLLTAYKKAQKFNFDPAEKSELLEVATALGRLVPKTSDARTIRFLTALGEADRYRSPETEIAFARVAPKKYTEYLTSKKAEFKSTRLAVDAALQGIREFAGLGTSDEETQLKKDAVEQLRRGLARFASGGPSPTEMSVPEVLRTLAAFKPDDIDDVLRRHLTNKGVFIRATAADLLGDRPVNKDNFNALKAAFTRALLSDKVENDAQIGTLDAMFKLDKKESIDSLGEALEAPDYLVRKKAFELLKDDSIWKDVIPMRRRVVDAVIQRKNTVLAYDPKTGTKLGQVLNTDADYKRAVSRKNGSVKAVLTTQKGTFTIDLLPEDAPLTVDNFIKLARARFFNGLEVHRVVPNFVMQDGDRRGDGNGGPGWSIRCEVNMVPYTRGAVGMALSGKDTGGSQWFVTHSPQPHLDGGYTVFGRVNETGMKVVDSIVRGDKIIGVKIVETASSARRPVKGRGE